MPKIEDICGIHLGRRTAIYKELHGERYVFTTLLRVLSLTLVSVCLTADDLLTTATSSSSTWSLRATSRARRASLVFLALVRCSGYYASRRGSRDVAAARICVDGLSIRVNVGRCGTNSPCAGTSLALNPSYALHLGILSLDRFRDAHVSHSRCTQAAFGLTSGANVTCSVKSGATLPLYPISSHMCQWVGHAVRSVSRFPLFFFVFQVHDQQLATVACKVACHPFFLGSSGYISLPLEGTVGRARGILYM